MNKILIDEFFTTTHEIKRLMEKKSDIDFKTKVVTRLQFLALKSICNIPNCTVGQLAEVLMLSSGSVAQLIERLEDKKWINKKCDKNDKRIFHIFLTKAGENELTNIKKSFMLKMNSMLSLISEKDLKEIIRIQKQLLEKLKTDK